MSIRSRLADMQDLLPDDLKHSLMCLRRRRLWQNAGIIFIHIPKVAGTSVAHTLYGRSMGHMTGRDIMRTCPHLFRSLPTFAISRNPWDRLISAYTFVKQSGTSVAGVRPFPIYQTKAFRSFDSFVEEWLVQQKLAQLDYVFRPQHLFVEGKRHQVIVDFVGRVDDLPAVEQFVTDSIGKKIVVPSKNRSARNQDYRSYYSPRLARIVGELYAEDVSAFGYDF